MSLDLFIKQQYPAITKQVPGKLMRNHSYYHHYCCPHMVKPLWCFCSGQDYSLLEDINASEDTPVIFAWRSGPGIVQHPNSQRGAAMVNFVNGSVDVVCDDPNHYFALHGALLLLVWMFVAPYGLYHAR